MSDAMSLPHNVDAERTILGAILIEPAALASAIEHVDGDDFYREPHRQIFEAMRRLFDANKPVDLVTVKEALGPALQPCGGPGYLASLLDGIPRITNVEHWCAIVRNHANFRRLWRASGEIVENARQGGDSEVAIDNALSSVLKVAERATSGRGFQGPEVYTRASLARLEKLHQSQGGLIGVPSGLKELDDRTSGFQAPNLIVIGARPGMGKSAAAMTIADNAAARGFVVAISSLEMDADELGVRQLAKRANMNPRVLGVSSEQTDKYWTRIAKAAGEMSKAQVYIDDDPYMTLSKIRARARRLKAEKGLNLLIIDYLQLIQGDSARKFENRQQEIATIARGLKNMAKDLEIPVIALSQLSRAAEARKDPRPILSDLRESGEVEQAADIVILLHRHHVQDSTHDPTEAEWNIAKFRNGRSGVFKLKYNADLTTFSNWPVYA